MKKFVFINKNFFSDVRSLTLSFLKLKDKEDRIKKQNRRFWKESRK